MERTGRDIKRQSPPRKLHKLLPSGPVPAYARSFDAWSIQMLANEARCVVEPEYSCVPLRGDPICRACHEQVRDTDISSEEAPG